MGFSGSIKLWQLKGVAVWEALGEQRGFPSVPILLILSTKNFSKNHCFCYGGKCGHLGDVPIVSGAACKSPKTKHLSGSSRLIALSGPAQNCLADLVGKGSQGNAALVLLFLRNIPGWLIFFDHFHSKLTQLARETRGLGCDSFPEAFGF